VSTFFSHHHFYEKLKNREKNKKSRLEYTNREKTAKNRGFSVPRGFFAVDRARFL
jgi:hypothetical protein